MNVQPGAMRSFYATGVTQNYQFRVEQLKKLYKAIVHFEADLYDALYKDLKKSKEEAYISELGIVLSEISFLLDGLEEWMQPESAPVGLHNFPSSAKVYRDSLGVVLVVAPWNYPVQLTLGVLAAAIAGGNCVIVKPSEIAVNTAFFIQKIIEHSFAADYINVLMGDGAELLPPLIQSFRFDHIFFTGSVPVGREIYKLAAAALVPVTLELGGKSPAIVETSANIKAAAQRLVWGKFLNAGQTCIAPDYLLVDNQVKQQMLDAMVTAIEKFYKDPFTSGEYGKIISTKRLQKLIGFLTDGELITGGNYDVQHNYLAPTILNNVSPDAAVMQEEIFGPVLPVLGFNNFEEALAIVQLNPDPLAFYLFTNNKKNRQRWINTVHFGGGCVNNTLYQFTSPYLPFGGVGNSGIGNYHGKYSFNTFTRPKPVLSTPTWFDPSFKYPPYKGRLSFFKKLFK